MTTKGDTRAATARGAVTGRVKEGVSLFAGIPYAAPPVDARRFGPPEPHPVWEERDARRFGPAAPQIPRGGLTDSTEVRWSEDCLTLNVATPAADERKRPVLVWIHGGGFRGGQGGIPWYDGSSFATRGDIVTVSINYRLGALGFVNLSGLPDGAAFPTSGVNGLLDQIAALEWVRDHIHAFGGDPDRVTVAGESAGAMSVGMLLGSPRSRGLFHRAIAQSGAAHEGLTADQAREVAAEWVGELGVTTVAELQALPVERILEAQVAVEDRFMRRVVGRLGLVFAPTLDGDVLPRRSIESIGAGSSSGVRLLVGTNRDETTLFGFGQADEAKLDRIAGGYFPDPVEALDCYRKAMPQATSGELEVAISTDQIFRIPALRLAEAHASNGGTAFVYLFTWASRAFGGKLGSTHALEIPFAFNNLGRPGVDTFLGPGALPQALAEVMHDAWISFVRDGTPSAIGLPSWSAYDARTRPVMELGEPPRLLSDPDPEVRALWEGLR